MEDLLQDFLVEGGDLLSGVDNKLVDLERAPDDRALNDIFRGFTPSRAVPAFSRRGRAGHLCHLTENLDLVCAMANWRYPAVDVILVHRPGARHGPGYLERADAAGCRSDLS